MCGISGFLHFASDRPADRQRLAAMTDVLAHRGPDGSGYHVSGNLALGHRRLAIIDTETGQQPMFSADRRLAVVFNGEIYNYLELHEELARLGHVFATHSDTEVILAAYRQWGLDCHCRFNGMWAFALWDAIEHRLLLSRDRMGEKPLYYAIHDNTLIFSSEVKGILHYGVPRVPDFSLTEIYLTLGFIPAPLCFFQGVSKLRPGHYLTVRDGRLSDVCYWDIPQTEEAAMLADAPAVHERFEWLLRDSVRLRMRADVPFGAFLSGGLDSASIVALMAETGSHPVETFTMGFEEKGYDERPLAELVARRFGTRHHAGVVAPDTLEDSLAAVLHHYDEPFGDSSAIPTGHVAAHARRSVKMVLTGDGGDEVLSGYSAYQSEKFSQVYRQLPGWLRALPETTLALAVRVAVGSPRFALQRYRRILQTAALPFEDRILLKAACAPRPVVERLTAPLAAQLYPVRQFIGDLMAPCRYRDSFYRMMYYNLKLTLPEDMLVKVDRMTMRHSLEARVPFVDHRLVEFMSGVHKEVKMPGLKRKSALRSTVAKRLPAELLRARKRGFVVPLRVWFRDGRNLTACATLRHRSGCGLDLASLDGLVAANAAGQADYGNFIWMVLVYLAWFGQS